jgi:NADP-dependent 3-hydroxy acid dehydrogenase YdfG
VLVARSLESIESVSRLLALEAPSTETMVFSADVLSPTQVGQAFQHAMEKFKSIDAIVHCAGVLGPIEKLADADAGAWSEAFVRE